MTAPIPAEALEEPEAPEEAGQHTHYEPPPEDGDTPDDDINDSPDEPGTEAPVEAETPETPVVEAEITPVKVRAGGEEVEVPGMLLAPEGAYVPKESLPRVLRILQQGVHHEKTWAQDINRERMEVRRQEALRTISEAKAAVYTKKMEEVFASDQSFLAFADNLQHNLALIQMEVGSAEDKARMESLKAGINLDQPYNQLQGADLQKAAAESLVQQYNELLELPDIRAIIPDRAAEDAVFGLLMRSPNRYIYPAPHDMPEIAVVKGQLVVDREVLAQDTRHLAGFRGPQQAVVKEQEAKVDRAKQLNAAVQKAPPVAPAKKPSGEKRSHQANTAEEWRRKLLRMARE